MSRFCGAIAASVLSIVLAGCTLLQARDDSRAFDGATVLVGRVTAPPDWQGPVVVVATTQKNGKVVVVHRVLLHEPGGYELIVPDGRFMLHAFGDRDGDGLPQRDDPATSMPVTIDVAGGGMVSSVDLQLVPGSADAVRRMLPAQMAASPLHSTQAGALADLAAPRFSAETGRQGYWAPLDAFRRDGGNIYFLEPYDPARIPVLFVHGAAGSAQDWRHFFDQLDRRRYQAWFFQYPSGAAMDSMAQLLYWKLFNLQLRYHFERLHLVAYSMGGLLVRRFLLDHGEEFPQIGRFISLSTPWGGEAAAALGVQHSPAVVPSWRDLQPEGPFLKHLFERPLPAGVDHLLLFSHRGGYNLLRPNSDGSVTLASQLRPEAQAEARLVMGFDEDHASIVTASRVIGQVARLLDAADARAVTVRRVPVLKLIPVSEAGATASKPLMSPLSADDSDGRLGPITPGTYDARLLAHAHSSMPPAAIAHRTRHCRFDASNWPAQAANAH